MKYTDEQIDKQFNLLSEEVQDKLFTPEIERKVQKIGIESGLLIDQIKKLNSLVNFRILGLLNEQGFLDECVGSLRITESDAKKIADAVSLEILSFIEKVGLPAKQETAGDTVVETPATSTPTHPRIWEKEPDVAPDNLPTGDESADFVSSGTRLGREQGESFLPPIPPKATVVEREPLSWDITHTPAHPFEEKMKRVFTAGDQSMNELELEPTTSTIPVTPTIPVAPTTPSIPQAPTPRIDPYREAV